MGRAEFQPENVRNSSVFLHASLRKPILGELLYAALD
jgi:hypothetical protein